MTNNEMDHLIEKHFAYEAAHDLEGVMSTFTDDVEHDVVGFPPGPQRGTAAVRSFYGQLFSLLTQEEYKPLRRYYGPDSLVDEVLYTGVVDGHLVGLDTKKGPATFRLLHVLEFRDGKISRENIWQDSDAIRVQLGSGA